MSPTLINDMKSDLQALNFKTASLVVTGTTTGIVARGTDVNVTVEYPIGTMFILLNWFGTDTPSGNYKLSATEMSEYIP